MPYRDSKLTRLLQDSLGGNTKTKIIATLSPSLDCLDESISTLKFADRAKQVMVTVRVNEQREIDPAYVEKLESELEQLREVVRLLKGGKSGNASSSSGNNNNNESEEHDESALRARLVRALNENTDLKIQSEKQQRELDQLRKQQRGGMDSSTSNGVSSVDSGLQLTKQVRWSKRVCVV